MTRQIGRPNATHEQRQWAEIRGHWQMVSDIDNPSWEKYSSSLACGIYFIQSVRMTTSLRGCIPLKEIVKFKYSKTKDDLIAPRQVSVWQCIYNARLHCVGILLLYSFFSVAVSRFIYKLSWLSCSYKLVKILSVCHHHHHLGIFSAPIAV